MNASLPRIEILKPNKSWVQPVIIGTSSVRDIYRLGYNFGRWIGKPEAEIIAVRIIHK